MTWWAPSAGRLVNARYVLWTPYDRERRWTADLIPEAGVADPRHPRFDDPIAAAIWIKVEIGQ